MKRTTTTAATAAPARKATTTTTTTARAELTPAEITTTAAALLLRHKTISGIDGHAAALREKYGPKSWAAVRKAAQDLRRAEIDHAADAARKAVFAYRPILGAAYRVLSSDSNYKALCKFAAATYKGTDADTAAAVVADYAPAVDAETGAPVSRVAFVNKARTMIFTAWDARELTDADALKALKAALAGLHKAARKATAGRAPARPDNKVATGRVVGVRAAVRDAVTGVLTAGADLTKAAADTAPARKAAAAAAAIVGAPVPADAVALAAFNADARRAYAERAAAALARERAALTGDAAAAGVATAPAPRKGRKGGKNAAPATDAPAAPVPDAAAVEAARAALASAEATIAEGRKDAAAALKDAATA